MVEIASDRNKAAPHPILVFSGPIYAICQREAVDNTSKYPVVMDLTFLVTEEVAGEKIILLFTTRELADEWLNSINNPAYAITTFRGPSGTVDSLEALDKSGIRMSEINRVPRENRETQLATRWLSPIKKLVAEIRLWMGQSR